MATEPKLILEEGNTYQFNFNDRVNTFLQGGFDIPTAERSEQGQRKRERGVVQGMADFNRIDLPIPFQLKGTGTYPSEDFVNRQSVLIKALNLPRTRLTWNPNPDECADVYFECYSGDLHVPLGFNYFVHHKEDLRANILADPHPISAEAVIFDTTTVLAEIDGETGEWSNRSDGSTSGGESSNCIFGSKSWYCTCVDNLSTMWIKRLPATPIVLTGYATKGRVTLWVWFDHTPSSWMAGDLIVRIGSSDANYREWTLTSAWTAAGLNEFAAGWNIVTFDLNAGYAVVGTPNMASVAYIYFGFLLSYLETNLTFAVDNMTISNGEVVAPRGNAAFVMSFTGVTGDYEPGFMMDIDVGSGNAVDQMWIARPESCDGAPTRPLVNPPVVPAGSPPISWEAIPAAGTTTNCLEYDYYRWSITTTEKFVNPCSFQADLFSGPVRILARVNNNNVSGGGFARWAGHDENGDACYGDAVEVPASANWQWLDLGTVGLPLSGFHRDVTLANTLTVLGLGLKAATTTGNWDVDFYAIPEVGGGARFLSPVSGKRYLNVDTRYYDSAGFSQSASTSRDDFQALKYRRVGDLKTLALGGNNLFIGGFNSSSPNSLLPIVVTRLSYVRRNKNAAP